MSGVDSRLMIFSSLYLAGEENGNQLLCINYRIFYVCITNNSKEIHETGH